ncbi:MAG: lantibiotic dehydratase family protein [Bacteroidota bacterium]
MSKSAFPYQAFENFVLRTPLLPFQFFQELTAKERLDDIELKRVFSISVVQEAVFLASPTLYFEIKKWVEGTLDPKKHTKVKRSFLKYIARMSSRSTPFGLFAGCTLGSFSETTQLELKNHMMHKRYTRPDMNYLVALSQDLARLEHIKKQLVYFPNSSIYPIGEQLRYIEYFYLDSRRQHHIVEIDSSEYLDRVLHTASEGATLQELGDQLIDESVSEDMAYGFLDELMENQVLTSSLEPSVSGPPFIEQILDVLQPLDGCDEEIMFLERISRSFLDLDATLGNAPEKYLEISEYLKNKPTQFELKYLFQTDMELQTLSCELSNAYTDHIKKSLILFNKLSAASTKSNLSMFREAFLERYEEREMPLCHVLDVETGIGYLQNSNSGDINPLVDELVIPPEEDPYLENEVKFNTVYRVLFEKVNRAKETKAQTIRLVDTDFENLPVNWDDLPDTLSTMIELVKENDDVKVLVSGCGGSSAANLLGRFCHAGSAITPHTKHIVSKESDIQSQKILAEIVHLPEARVGNILMRPSFREFEIPYLAKSNLSAEKQIPLEDLFVSVRNGRVVLRSKKYNKEIIPHLTNAHNYSTNALPIYQFLCDMQTQNLRGSIGFGFGPLNKFFDFFPRVEYGKLILQEAKWRLKKKHIEPMTEAKNDDGTLQLEVRRLRKSKGIPQYSMLSDGDNELLINFTNLDSVRMLINTVKSREEFMLSEFLHAQAGLVTSKEGHFANQVVMSFYNQKKLNTRSNIQNEVQYAAT